MGSHDKADLSKFTSTGIAAGVYSLDVYTNGEWKGRYDITVKKQKDGKIGACYDKEMLNQYGISEEKLNDQLRKQTNYCGPLSEWIDSDNVTDALSKPKMRLDISVPQAYQNQTYRNYVSPEFWETGIPAMNIGWNGNIWNSHYNSNGGTDTTTGYLGLNAAMTYGGWSLKHRGALSWQDKKGTEWNSTQTFLPRPLPAIKSIISAGQVNGSGEFFDSVSIRGVNLKTDDEMFPDGMRNFAPEIRGIAQTNALITVRQSGSVIYQTTVTPGPFVLKDVYPTGFGNNLEVTVKESNGSTTSFIVPYNSVSKLLRPGMNRYELTVGKPDDSYLKDKPVIYQGTFQHGFNNIITGYAGVSGFDNYQSFLLGTGVNTSLGGFSFDVTDSKLKGKRNPEKGKMYRATFSRSFSETNTSFSVVATKYSDKGFYNLNNALYINDRPWETYRTEKSNINLSVSQQLPDGWGSVNASGRLVEYWDQSKKDKQYQVTYNNVYKRLSWSVSAERTKSLLNGVDRSDSRISLNFSLPMNFGDNRRTTLTSNTLVNNSRYSSTQVGLNGALGEDNDFNYGLNTTVGDNRNISLNAGYKNTWANLNGTYGQGSDYRQSSISGSGTMLVHSEGVTFSPESGNTLALIKAENAKGGKVVSSPGTRIDSNGFAIISTLRPYKVNSIEVDPKGTSDNVTLTETVKHVAPYQGGIVKVTFNTELNDNLYIKAKQANGKAIPFGSIIYNTKGDEIGTVSQGSMLFIKDASSSNAVVKWESGSCKFALPKNKEGEVKCD
ncbi:outer membrane usher protein MrkC-like [Bactrocera neohumeralis]|uniref:outer membrane usher protein MrkC-like n=1 Tax=Bactrocera neohumeralis TaxID=98809 RepID=UPI002166A12E|nr:outer membrane usher protein MrkC-like [Bactrocera neohumeralis]